jgi:hypothetical protein
MISDASVTIQYNGYTAAALSPRLMELRSKIHDSQYLDGAIQRIAQVLSSRLVEDDEQIHVRG